MNRLLRVTFPVLLAVLVNLLTLGAHSTAMASSGGHSSTGMKHGSTTSLNCFAICTTSSPEKQRLITTNDEKDDDDPTLPFYLASQQSIVQAFEEKHSSQTKVAAELRPPPGPPIYVLNSVLRF